MATRKTIFRNLIWNWAGMVVNMAAGFLTAPFLVYRLGESGYGLWIVIASFTSYFGMLDLGVRGAVGRQVAFRRTHGDRAGVNAILSTSLAILSVAGALALMATFGVALVFSRIFEVPPDQSGSARLALILVGLNLALWLPLSVFDGMLWAAQRFDVMNAIDITATSLRTALTFLLIGRGGGIVTLAWLNLAFLAGAQAAKAIVAFRIEPWLRAGRGFVRAGAAREIFGFGVWGFLIAAGRTLTTQASPLVIGARLGIGLVTPFSIATRLIGYAGALIVAGTGVLTPVATAIHAQGGTDRQRRLFVEGGKYCFAMSLGFATLFLLLGRSLISSWMGPNLGSATGLLAILTVGEVMPMSQWITHGVILGMGRHRPLALANIAECVVGVTLACLLAKPFGLEGVCVAFAVPATLSRGIFQLLYGCRLVGISARVYLTQAIAPAVGMAAFAAAVLGAAVAWGQPRGAAGFLLYAAAFGLAYLAAAAVLLVGFERLNLIRVGLTRRLAGLENSR